MPSAFLRSYRRVHFSKPPTCFFCRYKLTRIPCSRSVLERNAANGPIFSDAPCIANDRAAGFDTVVGAGGAGGAGVLFESAGRRAPTTTVFFADESDTSDGSVGGGADGRARLCFFSWLFVLVLALALGLGPGLALSLGHALDSRIGIASSAFSDLRFRLPPDQQKLYNARAVLSEMSSIATLSEVLMCVRGCVRLDSLLGANV